MTKWTVHIEHLELSQKQYRLEYDDRLIAILTKEQFESFEKLLSKEQPTAGDFTKEIRQWIKDCHYLDTAHSLPDFVLLANKLLELCDRLDRAEARSIDCPNRPASKTEVEMAKRLCDYQDEVHKLKATQKDLLDACERMLGAAAIVFY